MASKDEKESVEWFNDTLQEIVSDRNKMFKKRVMPEVGSMYLYAYDAKHKKTLPYWDAQPLVFPIEFYGDGFLGLNMHYLTPNSRQILFNSLTNIFANNDKFDMTTKLYDGEKSRLAYATLKQYGDYFYKYNECLKRYLYGHVRSGFYLVNPKDWKYVISLPLARWQYTSR